MREGGIPGGRRLQVLIYMEEMNEMERDVTPQR